MSSLKSLNTLMCFLERGTDSGLKSRCWSDVDESIHPHLGGPVPPSLIQQQLDICTEGNQLPPQRGHASILG